MKEYWVNVYDWGMGNCWFSREDTIFTYVRYGKLLYRIHVKLKNA